jgi:succinyl-diaminopimelate desuccinylase
VGEPSSINELGDTMRIGRRGTINAALTAHGVQGHTAYGDHVVNPVHLLSPLLSELTTIRWDEGTEHFPPTSVQISNINAGTGATNVTPGHATVLFNFRNSPASPAQALKDRVIDLVSKHGVAHYDLDWNVSGEPFFTEPGKLSTAVSDAMEAVINRRPVLDTGGGTSDGRFIAPLDAEVVEAGPVNLSIHKIDEHVKIDDLDHIMEIYYESLCRLLTPDA